MSKRFIYDTFEVCIKDDLTLTAEELEQEAINTIASQHDSSFSSWEAQPKCNTIKGILFEVNRKRLNVRQS